MKGYVDTNYVIFVIDGTDQEALDLQIDSLCDTLYMEARLRAMGFEIQNEGEEWNI